MKTARTTTPTLSPSVGMSISPSASLATHGTRLEYGRRDRAWAPPPLSLSMLLNTAQMRQRSPQRYVLVRRLYEDVDGAVCTHVVSVEERGGMKGKTRRKRLLMMKGVLHAQARAGTPPYFTRPNPPPTSYSTPPAGIQPASTAFNKDAYAYAPLSRSRRCMQFRQGRVCRPTCSCMLDRACPLCRC
jgi:hypothetical protein